MILIYDPDNLFECSEYKVFRIVNALVQDRDQHNNYMDNLKGAENQEFRDYNKNIREKKMKEVVMKEFKRLVEESEDYDGVLEYLDNILHRAKGVCCNC